MTVRLLTLVVLALAASTAWAATDEADGVVGQWLTAEKDARIEIVKTGDTYSGKIVWLKEPTYPAGDAEAGKERHDRYNTDASKQARPIIGLDMLSGFKYEGDNSWTGGTIYNPKNGKTYKANMSLGKNGELKVRGYIGISLIGETAVWTRYEQPASAQATK